MSGEGMSPAIDEDIMRDSLIHPQPAEPVPYTRFDFHAYQAKGQLKEGEDRYSANKFNQAASDAIPHDRVVPDTREKTYVLG